MLNINLEQSNRELKHKTPQEIIDWALLLSNKRIVTTSFGSYSAVLLNTFFEKDKTIKVIWCDTGFNLPATYIHAHYLIKKFKLNISVYSPLISTAYIRSLIGMPSIDDPKHQEFSEIVKLEPFRRALNEHQPEIWFTNIRVRQTKYRNSQDILSYSKEGIIKVSPFYYWTDDDLEKYLRDNNLPKNGTYFDPTKVLNNRECGLQLQ